MVAGNKELRERLVEEKKSVDLWCSNRKLELELELGSVPRSTLALRILHLFPLSWTRHPCIPFHHLSQISCFVFRIWERRGCHQQVEEDKDDQQHLDVWRLKG